MGPRMFQFCSQVKTRRATRIPISSSRPSPPPSPQPRGGDRGRDSPPTSASRIPDAIWASAPAYSPDRGADARSGPERGCLIAPPGEDQVGHAGQVAAMQTEAVAEGVDEAAYGEFGSGILPANAGHAFGVIGGGKRIHGPLPKHRSSCRDSYSVLTARGHIRQVKGVFDTKPGSGYDDSLAERYHFPARRNYLEVAHSVVGDWILYREPQRNRGRKAYVGAAMVVAVEPDHLQPGHAYARMTNYFPFESLVPFSGAPHGSYWETSLRTISDSSRIGQSLQGKSMRLLSDRDFAEIVSAGIADTLTTESSIRYGPGVSEPTVLPLTGYADLADEPFVRRVEQTLLNRKVRDTNFRRLVCEAYDDTCAVTGLRIINGGGRSEVQAAHIWPVEKGGPDVVQNGIALSGTVHWLFDRHLMSLTDDYRVLVAHNRVPAELRGLFERQMDRIRLPSDPAMWPHPKYLQRHREAYAAA